MNLSTVLNPPLKVNNVEIHSINNPEQRLSLVVHVPVHPNDVHTPQVQSWMAKQIQMAYRYLHWEGFISLENKNWRHNATAIFHPPLKQL